VAARFLVRITATAEADIEEIWSYIAHDDQEAADRFLDELDRQLRILERFPERCPLIPENRLMGTAYRHLIHGEYRTIFRSSGRTILVLRIIHGARLLDSSMFDIRG
jgi:toxin ParE1/3/4